jgi:hypothetical protein
MKTVRNVTSFLRQQKDGGNLKCNFSLAADADEGGLAKHESAYTYDN